MIFEKLVERRQDRARPGGVDPDIEVEFVFEKIDIAMPQHGEKLAGDAQLVGVNDALLDRKRRGRFVRHAVAGARKHLVHQLGERPEDRDRENISVRDLDLPRAVQRVRVAAESAEIELAAERALRGFVFEIEIR